MADAAALGLDETAACFRQVIASDASGVVLAVSGGSDSLALMHLAARLRDRLPPLTVGTVDHGLRLDSAADGAGVETAATALGLRCRRLTWLGRKPERAVQETARRARYQLLTALCAEVGADHLLTAHTLDDQAETVLFRLLRGSGFAGLAGMREIAPLGRVTLARPFLDVAKARLIATCAAYGVAFRDDPANSDPRFARARMRRILPLLAAEGFDTPALARLAGRTERADRALRQSAHAAYRTCVLQTGRDTPSLDGMRLAALPQEIGIRVLAEAIARAGGKTDRLERLERLAARIAMAVEARTELKATLGGAMITLAQGGAIRIALEATPRRRGMRASTMRAKACSARDTDAVEGFPWQA